MTSNQIYFVRQVSGITYFYIIYKWKNSWSIAIALFWCTKTDGITSVMFDFYLLSRNLVPTWLSFWQRILKRSTTPYAWRPKLPTYFAPLRNILVGPKTMPRESDICSCTTCTVTTPQTTSIPSLNLVADRARTSVLRVQLLFSWTYHITLSSLFWKWAAEVTVYLKTFVYDFAISWNGVTLTCLVYPAHLSLPTYMTSFQKLRPPRKVWLWGCIYAKGRWLDRKGLCWNY